VKSKKEVRVNRPKRGVKARHVPDATAPPKRFDPRTGGKTAAKHQRNKRKEKGGTKRDPQGRKIQKSCVGNKSVPDEAQKSTEKEDLDEYPREKGPPRSAEQEYGRTSAVRVRISVSPQPKSNVKQKRKNKIRPVGGAEGRPVKQKNVAGNAVRRPGGEGVRKDRHVRFT